MRTLPPLEDLALAAEVAEAGGVAAAARRLGLAKSSVSQRLAGLERAVGARLFQRHAQGLSPTEAGQRLVARAQAMRREAEGALADLAALARPAGTVRLSLPAGMADAFALPSLAAFLEAEPEVALDVVAADRLLDPREERLDLMLRFGWAEDPALVARRLGLFGEWLVASPDYLATHGAPATPADLARHAFIGFAGFGRRDRLDLTGPEGEAATVELPPRIRTTAGATILDWALAGAGIARSPDFRARPHVEAGRLVRLLPGWSLPGPALFLLYPPDRLRRPAAAALIAHLLRDIPGRIAGLSAAPP